MACGVNDVRLFSLLFPLFLSVDTLISRSLRRAGIGKCACTLLYLGQCDEELCVSPYELVMGAALAILGLHLAVNARAGGSHRRRHDEAHNYSASR